jgi:hypothetical protein
MARQRPELIARKLPGNNDATAAVPGITQRAPPRLPVLRAPSLLVAADMMYAKRQSRALGRVTPAPRLMNRNEVLRRRREAHHAQAIVFAHGAPNSAASARRARRALVPAR